MMSYVSASNRDRAAGCMLQRLLTRHVIMANTHLSLLLTPEYSIFNSIVRRRSYMFFSETAIVVFRFNILV
jgi:hypothetical protein